jgi:hypothetical protein
MSCRRNGKGLGYHAEFHGNIATLQKFNNAAGKF